MELDKESLSEQIYNRLKRRIIDLEIVPGEKIGPSSLEREFGVSRAPIREALNRLKEDNLVESKPRVGYFVVHLTPDKIHDLYDLRVLFETYGLERSIPRIPQTKIEELQKESHKLLVNSYSQQELRDRFDQTDRVLHKELILERVGNQFFIDFSTKTIDLIRVTRHLNERIEEAVEEHLRILEAIAKQDINSGKKFLEEHLRNVEEEIIENHEPAGKRNDEVQPYLGRES
ncbi:MAG: GntR family transcriptional regulator [Candidatus Bipolaricaulia bacterium]